MPAAPVVTISAAPAVTPDVVLVAATPAPKATPPIVPTVVPATTTSPDTLSDVPRASGEEVTVPVQPNAPEVAPKGPAVTASAEKKVVASDGVSARQQSAVSAIEEDLRHKRTAGVVVDISASQVAAAPLAAPTNGWVVSDVSAVNAAAATARTQVLVDVVESVCDAIMVSPGILRGQGEIRIQLKPDVLDGTEIRLEAKGRTMSVMFQPATSEAQQILEQNIGQFEQHLAGRIHNYQIAVSIRKGTKDNERV